MIPVRSILGMEGVPSHRTTAGLWLERAGVSVSRQPCKGGLQDVVNLSDLPAPVRLAYITRQLDAAGLPAGTYDEAAHDDFAALPPKMRAQAVAKAEIAWFMAGAGKVLSWSQKAREARARFGDVGTSQNSLSRISKAIEGVDPINFAPALVADYRMEGAPRKEVSEAAWSLFMTIIFHAAPDFPLTQAWQDVEDLKATNDWAWPSWPTIHRRWDSLTEAQKLHARHGHSETVKRLAQPAMRDKTSILPLEWVSLDGRTNDFWATAGDGKARRYTFLALVDCATGFVLDWELAQSENARSTVRLIKRACQTYGIFDRLYPDNGSAFAGHLVGGGAKHKFRNGKSVLERVKPLGICHHLGIQLTYALPGNGQAKTAERTFSTLSRVLDDRAEFKGAHAGHKPGAAPDKGTVPVDLDEAVRVIIREVARHNAESGWRGQGMAGRSYQAAFQAGLALRVRHQPTERQLYLAGLIYTPVKVDRWGRMTIDGWTYGQPDTQEALLPYHQCGDAILLGRDPDDFAAPALAWNADNRLICEAIQPVTRGAYGSVDGVRDAKRNRNAAQDASRKAKEANNYMQDAEFAAQLAAIPTPAPFVPDGAPVVAGRFGGSLQTKRKAKPEAAPEAFDMIEYRRNFDAHLADIEAGLKPKLA